eukprot:COSAG04_NODE_1422_length_6834_cov_13.536154_3_plen_378_part_00
MADLFPGGAFGYRSPFPTDRPMALRQLASHTSGLPRETPFVCVHCNETEAMILAAVKQQWLVNDPGTRFHYSNLGFAVLGRALGHAAGQSYEALIQSRILQPLNMTTATFTTPTDLSGVAVGLTSEGSAGILRHGDGWGAPCGDLLASSADMAKWLMLFARRREPRSSDQIVDGSTLTEMLQPVVMLRDGSSAVGSPFEFKCALPVTPTHPTPRAHTKVLRGQVLERAVAEEQAGRRSRLPQLPHALRGPRPRPLHLRADRKSHDRRRNPGGAASEMNSSGCGQDPVPEDSVWTIPAADILTAALQEILWSHQPRTPIAEAQRLVGDYFGDWSVEQLDASTLQARLGVISAFVAKTLAALLPPISTAKIADRPTRPH